VAGVGQSGAKETPGFRASPLSNPGHPIRLSSCDRVILQFIGKRQQCGLHGPASGGGQAEAIGNALPEAIRPAAALISFSIFFEPHFGQAGFSVLPTSNSA